MALILFGAAGFAAYLGGSGGNHAPDRTASAKILPLKKEGDVNVNAPDPPRTNVTSSIGPTPGPPSPSLTNTNSKQRAAFSNSSTEPVYYCGAMTKKGTACTRRVKSPGRCWQHLGQPAAGSTRN
jgi:hypothetical protein